MSMLPLDFGGPPGGASPLPARDYQTEGIDAILSGPARGVTRPLLVMPTGGGKTVVFAHAVHRRGGRALVMAHRDELIEQAAEKLDMVAGGGLDLGIVKARRNEAHAPVVVGSVQTLARPGRAEAILAGGPLSTVVVDEAHHSVADSYLAILGRLGCMGDGGPLTIGATATAARTDKLALGEVWQEIICPRGLIQMIAEGWLVDVHGQQIGSDFNVSNLATRRGDYTDSSIEAELDRADAFEAGVRAWRQYAPDRLTVAFTPTVAAAYQCAAAFEADGIPAGALDGTTPPEERRDLLKRLERGKIRVLANCGVLTEGWDCPPVSCCLLYRPTKSKPLFIQMVGRILRPFIGLVGGRPYTKDDALVLDITGVAETHGLATLADLAGLKQRPAPGKPLTEAAEEEGAIERRQVAVGAAKTRQVELLSRSELHWIAVDRGWLLRAGPRASMLLIPAGDELADAWTVWHDDRDGRSLRQVSPKTLTLEWARGVGEEVARTSPTFARGDAAWRRGRASTGQLDALGRMGIKTTGPLTKGEASDLMETHIARRTIRKLAGAGR
jgi:superfamily II DNA or RNA helicase